MRSGAIGKLCELHERTHPARLFRTASPERRQRAGRLSPLWHRLGRLLRRLG